MASPILNFVYGLVSANPIASAAFAGLLVATCYKKLSEGRSERDAPPLPPGPKGKPLIKNLLDLPLEHQWLVITEMEKEYGKMIYFKVAGQHLIYVNDFDIAVDLFERRSRNYSDRAQTTMLNLMGANDFTSLIRYGDDWRISRRLMHQEFNINTPLRYKQIQIKYARGVLELLKEDPTAFDKHFKYFTAGIVLEPVYGFKISPYYDPYIRMAEEGMEFVRGLIPGAFLADAIPALRYMPEWFPGAGFKKKARIWGKALRESITKPFEIVSTQLLNGSAEPSVTASWLQKMSHYPPEEKRKLEHLMKYVAGTTFLGSYETTSGSLLNFVLHMIENPGAQTKAHEELDRVIGRGRLPDLDDRESLPYIDAICKEVMRTHPIVPLGVPHVAVAEDVYNGMRIPKNTIVVPNVWYMSHNENDNGPDPDEFRPERFMEAERRDPATYVFGFGRR